VKHSFQLPNWKTKSPVFRKKKNRKGRTPFDGSSQQKKTYCMEKKNESITGVSLGGEFQGYGMNWRGNGFQGESEGNRM